MRLTYGQVYLRGGGDGFGFLCPGRCMHSHAPVAPSTNLHVFSSQLDDVLLSHISVCDGVGGAVWELHLLIKSTERFRDLTNEEHNLEIRSSGYEIIYSHDMTCNISTWLTNLMRHVLISQTISQILYCILPVALKKCSVKQGQTEGGLWFPYIITVMEILTQIYFILLLL